MTDFTPTHVHRETGEQFELWSTNEPRFSLSVLDKDGEFRNFRSSMLSPIQPVEEWEPVQSRHIRMDAGLLEIYSCKCVWVDLKHPDVRIVDGRIERRKG